MWRQVGLWGQHAVASLPRLPSGSQAHHPRRAIANNALPLPGIKAGYYAVGIAGGIESFTQNPLIWEGRCTG